MKTINSIEKVNQLSENEFISTFGNIFEKTNWIANKAFSLRPYKDFDDLISTIIKIYENSSKEDCITIFNAHPELVVEKKLTEDSHKEQKGANLNRCNNEEFSEFKNLNIEYRIKFGFPFIIAVKGKNKKEILNNFRKRISSEPEIEFNEAIKQVKKIASLRLEDLNNKGI